MDNKINNPSTSDTSVRKKRILIIEDDFYIRDLYMIQATSSGFNVIIASNGSDGLEKIRSEQPDMVLLDLMTPGIDGVNILKTIKNEEKYSKIPFIVVTNLEDASVEAEVRKIGVVDYLKKVSYTPESVMQRVKNYFTSSIIK